MTQTLRDFIEAREAEIKSQRAALLAELEELRAAKSAISTATSGSHGQNNTKQSGRTTHKQLILQVLEEHPDGLTAESVMQKVLEKFGVEIPSTSISSQLSRAKSEGNLILEQGTRQWRLLEHRNSTEKQNEVSTPYSVENEKSDRATNTTGLQNPNTAPQEQ